MIVGFVAFVFLAGSLTIDSMAYAQAGVGDDILIGNTGNVVPGQDDNVAAEPKAIPGWVDQNFRWYAEGAIAQSELVNAIKFLIDDGIMILEPEKSVEDNNPIEVGEIIETAKDDGQPVPYSCDGAACSCEGNGCWDLKSDGKCHEGKLWCEDNEDDASYTCVCWEKTTTGMGLVDFDEIQGESINPELLNSDMANPSTSSGGNGDIIIIGSFTSQSETASEIVGDILRKGGTTSVWEDGIAAFSEHGMSESVIPELQGIVVLCNNVIDKKTQSINAELEILDSWLEIISDKQQSNSYDASGRLTSDTTTEAQNYESDLDFITRNLGSIDQKINALDTGIEVLEGKLSTVGDDAQLANIDLQNSLQKQQQTLQTMSNISKMLHDTAKSIIQNMRA